MKNYDETIKWLYAQLPMFSRIGAAAYKPGLERTIELAEFFDNPQEKFKSIHIAGTNGKGSVSNMLAAILQSQGYKVGLYTSPHLVDFRERMRINGKMIPKEEVIEFVDKWRVTSETNETANFPTKKYNGDRPSFFELTMIMAFDWFAKQKVDYAVIEVGMGGRLDSTNIIKPLLSVITNISKDHTQFLGNTLEEIAREKAGVIKPEIPIVIGEGVNETEKVFLEKAFNCNAPIRLAYKEIDDDKNRSYNCPLNGDYQNWNINTARVAIDELIKSGVRINPDAIRQGFANVEKLTGFTGRWTKLSDSPLIICDTGHNIAGLNFNLIQLSNLMKERKNGNLRFVIGFVADKDIDNILRIFPLDANYYLTQAQIPRALPYDKLHKKFRQLDNRNKENTVKCFPTVSEAVLGAKKDSSPEDLIFIGGSTFIVADALKNKDLFFYKNQRES